MTKKEVLAVAQPLVQQLAKCFAAPCPHVHACREIALAEYGKTNTLGLYTTDIDEEPRILLRIDTFRVDIVLHEFAHHLQAMKYENRHGELPPEMEVHGKEFFDELWQVASHYYGDAGNYDWMDEDECGVRAADLMMVPPLMLQLLKQHRDVFGEYVQKREKEMVPCKACAAAAGAGR